MFKWFFRKKKKTPAPPQPSSQQTSSIKTVNTSQIPMTKSNMSSPQQTSVLTMKPQTNSDPITTKLEYDNDAWIYEYILQYLTSPLWKIPISQFIDENCLVFDNEETNQFSYTDVHNNFKSMIDKMLEELVKEINISEEKFMEQLEKGLKVEAHRRIFEQLLIVDNFIVFKKLMLKRNKELELEALKALEQQEAEKNRAGQDINMERMKLEAEKAQIEHAIAMSLALEEEKKKLKEQEDLELQQVLKESELEYQKQQEKIKETQQKPTKNQEIVEKPQEIAKIDEKAGETEGKQTKITEKPALSDSTFQRIQDNNTEISGNLQESVVINKKSAVQAEKTVEEPAKVKKTLPPPEEEQKEFVNIKEISKKPEEDTGSLFQTKGKPVKPAKIEENAEISIKKQATHELPPLKPDMKYDPLSLNDLLKEKQSLAAKLDALKAKPTGFLSSVNEENKEKEKKDDGESFLERKKRLEKQRELILKKKKEEREKELKEYKESGGTQQNNQQEPEKQKKPLLVQESIDFSQKDLLVKRQEIMKKFKENKE